MWVRTLVSMGLVGCIFFTSSLVALAQPTLTGELLVAGPGVVVNGEPAANGRTLALPSNVMTTGSTYATLNFGKAGKLQLAPGSTFTIDGADDQLRGTLAKGSVTVITSAKPVTITTPNGKTVVANAGDMVVADPTTTSQTTSRRRGFPLWGYAAIAGIIVVLVVAVTRGGNSNNGTSPTT